MPDQDDRLNTLCDGDPLARALAKLQPAPAGVEVNALLYKAGEQAAEHRSARWRRAFFTQSSVVGILVGLALFHFANVPEAANNQTERIVYHTMPPVEQAPTPRRTPELSQPDWEYAYDGPNPAELAEYLRMRQEVLTAGLGLLPTTKTRPNSETNPAELEKSLNLPKGVLTAPYRIPPKLPKEE